MPAASSNEPSFGHLVRETREGFRWSQDDLAEKSGVSRPAIQRIETGKTTTPEADSVRKLGRTLKLDPREVVIALGFVTRDELGLPPRAATLEPTLQRAARLLADTNIPERARQALRKGIDAAIDLWFDAFGARPTREPAARQRSNDRETTR